jgi:two-component system, OmpR family, response regulator
VDRTVSPTVVIADDDSDIRALVKISATRAGLEVVAEASDGNEAWAAIQRTVPDLAILDVSMPGQNGLDICRLVRADSSLDEVQILLVSAAVDDASVAAGMRAGAADYLSKPFSPRELASRLSAHIGGTR